MVKFRRRSTIPSLKESPFRKSSNDFMDADSVLTIDDRDWTDAPVSYDAKLVDKEAAFKKACLKALSKPVPVMNMSRTTDYLRPVELLVSFVDSERVVIKATYEHNLPPMLLMQHCWAVAAVINQLVIEQKLTVANGNNAGRVSFGDSAPPTATRIRDQRSPALPLTWHSCAPSLCAAVGVGAMADQLDEVSGPITKKDGPRRDGNNIFFAESSDEEIDDVGGQHGGEGEEGSG